MNAILIALFLVATPPDTADLVKAATKKPVGAVITNESVKKNATKSGGATATSSAPTIPKSALEKQAEEKRLRAAADARLHEAENVVTFLEGELAAVELSYYEANDPDVRDRDITTRFALTQEKLAAARKELAEARDAAAKLQPKNVIVHE